MAIDTYPAAIGATALYVHEPVEVPVSFSGAIENMIWAPDSQSVAVVHFPIASGEEADTERLESSGTVYVLRPGTWDVALELATKIPLFGSFVSWSPDSRLLVTGAPHTATVWDAAAAEAYFSFMTDEDVVPLAARWIRGEELELAAAMPGSRIGFWSMTAGRDATLGRTAEFPLEMIPLWAWWSPDTYRLAIVLAKPSEKMTAYCLAVIEEDGEPRLIDLPRGLVENPGWSHVWSPDSRWMAVAVESIDESVCRLVRWDGRDGFDEYGAELGAISLFGSEWSADGAVVAATTGEVVIFFDGSRLEPLEFLESFYAPRANPFESAARAADETSFTIRGFTRSCSFAPDGSWFVAGNVGGFRAWPLRSS